MISFRPPQRPLTCFVLSIVALGATAHADVRILEQPGTDYHTIQAAVDAAFDGETLLLAGESYEGFELDGKGLTLIALPGLGAEITSQVVVSNVPAGSSVRFDGLVITGRSYDESILVYANESAVELLNNQGHVHLYGCQLTAGSGPENEYNEYEYPAGGHGLQAENCASVAVLDCDLIGGNGGGIVNSFEGYGGAGGHGIWSQDSAIALYDSALIGGNGGQAGTYGGNGGSGIRISGLGMFASGCDFQGGDGGHADDFIGPVGGNGGSGVWVDFATTSRLVDNDYTAGDAGEAPVGIDGEPGELRHWEAGILNETPGTRRSLGVAQSLVGDGDDFLLHYEGEPGDLVFLSKAARLQFQFSTTPPGVRLVPFLQQLPIGGGVLVGPSGSADLIVGSHELGVGDHRSLTAQALVLKAGGGRAIGGAVLLSSMDDEGGDDCTGNGRDDIFDIILGVELDCDGNFVPDSCPPTVDCNSNGVPDGMDIDCGGLEDLNSNRVLDVCEVGLTVYVDAAAGSGGDGSFVTPFDNLAEAFDLALDGWKVEIAAGTYAGAQNRDIDLAGRSLDIYCPTGAATCTLDLGNAGRAFFTASYQPISDLRVTGITFLDGNPQYDAGGALALASSTAILEDCTFRDCHTNQGGGAVIGGSLDVFGCLFEGNSALNTGGAIFSNDLRIKDSHFEGNSGWTGGAVISYSEAIIASSSFVDNTAQNMAGGAIALYAYYLSVDNCLFIGNSAVGGGGAITVGSHPQFGISQPATAVVTSSTFVSNQAGDGSGPFKGGGAIYLASSGSLVLRNAVFRDNTSGSGASIRLFGHSSWVPVLDIDYCNLEGHVAGIDSNTHSTIIAGAAILDQDPLFTNPGADDYTLEANSPCIDSGDNTALAADTLDVDMDGDTGEVVPEDLAGNPRQADDPAVVDSGNGSAPITDMGAFERQVP